MTKNKIAILDAGAQYAKVIDRRVRELNVCSEILPLNTPINKLKQYGALIISGGPQSVYSQDAPQYDPKLFQLNIPILGICYGMQLMIHALGGKVEKKTRREDGPCQIEVDHQSLLFTGLKSNQEVLMAHGDSVDQLAPDFKQIADSAGLVAGVENTSKKLYGVQFHPEVDLTQNGKVILENFLFKIAQLKPDFTVEDRLHLAIAQIQQQVGNKKVLILVSGGVDSTVCASLLTKALKAEQIYALHIDTGFMRYQESKQVEQALEKMGLNLIVRDASQEFYSATTTIDGIETLPLNQVTDPQVKRQIIGDTFMRVSQSAIAQLQLDPEEVLLVQGTLRPDLIESASSKVSKNADVIKTHHNDTNLVRLLRSQGKVVEPLVEYHKDEVRQLALELGLPEAIAWRQPFPGPGLAIRILASEKPYLTADFEDISQRLAKFNNKDIKAHLLPVRTVGVQGDGRTFSYLVSLSGGDHRVKDLAFWLELLNIAREIPKYIHQANRVVYLFGNGLEENERIQTITPTLLEPMAIKQLQEADEIVNQILRRDQLIKTLSQVPVVSFPVNFGVAGARSIAVRTFITNDFMTGVPALPGKEMPIKSLLKMVKRITQEVAGVARVAYDLTSKPPGTTEWE